MLKNYVLYTLREIQRNKFLYFTIIIGLSASLLFSLISILFVIYESSYDKHIANYDNKYRLNIEVIENGESVANLAGVPFGVGQLLKDQLPEINDYTKIRALDNLVMNYEDKSILESETCFADRSVIDFLSLEVIKGDALGALSKPSEMIISESTAKSYFGNSDPINKEIKATSPYGVWVYSVKAVYKDIPQTSHLPKYKFMLSMHLLEGSISDWVENVTFQTYISVKPGSDLGLLSKKIQEAYDRQAGEKLKAINLAYNLSLQPLSQIHNDTEELFIDNTLHGVGENSLLLITIIAFSVLVIGWINYVNLKTANSIDRAREVGVRKILGANKNDIMVQFFSDTITITMISFVISMLFFFLAKNYLETTFNFEIQASLLFTHPKGIVLVTSIIGAMLLSACLCGVFLSSLAADDAALKGYTFFKNGKVTREVLMGVQLVLSITTIFFFVVFYDQYHMLLTKEKNLSTENVLAIRTPPSLGKVDFDGSEGNKFETLKNELVKHSGISNVGNSLYLPSDKKSMTPIIQDASQQRRFNSFGLWVDSDFLKTIGTKLVVGRDFRSGVLEHDNVIVNVELTKKLNIESPEKALGQKLYSDGTLKTIVGVVSNFAFRPLKEPMEDGNSAPSLILLPVKSTTGFILVKYARNQERLVITHIENAWRTIFAGEPFNFLYLHTYFSKQFKSEMDLNFFLSSLLLVILVLNVMGIWGVSKIHIKQKNKEMGIRKVLGADNVSLVVILSRRLVMLLAASLVISLPLAFIMSQKWLDGYAVRVDISFLNFIVPLVTIVVIIGISVFYHIAKVVTTNPIHFIRETE